MTTYCGVDFQTRQQTICYCETADGEIHLKESGSSGGHRLRLLCLFHRRGDRRKRRPAALAPGLSNSSRASAIGCSSAMRPGPGGWPSGGRKHDRRDTGLSLDLLPKQEFPQMHQAKLLRPGLRIIFAILPSRL